MIVAFQDRDPKKMAAPAYRSTFELNKNVLVSPWKGKLIIQGCLLCDITLWSAYRTVIPVQIPQELDFKYVIKVSSLKERLPEAAFRRENYLEQKVCCQDLCFDLYEVELSNKQGKNIDKLTDYIKNKQLAIIKCLEDRGIFILFTSSALIPEPDFGGEQMGLHGLHLFHSQSAGVKDLKVEDDISLKVIPVLPALNCALLEAKKSLPEEGIPPNILVKHNFQEQYKVDRSFSLTAAPQDGMKETTLIGKLSSVFDFAPPLEKCPLACLTQLKCYFSEPSGYVLEVSDALDSLVEPPQSPCIAEGICDAGFSSVMTPDPEFLDSEIEVNEETQTEKNLGKMLRAKKRAVVPLTGASNLRVQLKRKASMSATGVPSRWVNLCHPLSKRTAPGADSRSHSPVTLKLVEGQFPQKRKRGAEVLTAQFVQKSRLDEKSQAAPVSKDTPVVPNAKWARKQERSPVIPQPKAPEKKSPPKQKVQVARGSRNPRIRKQPPPAKKKTTLHLQPEISSDAQKDGINISTAQPENNAVAPKGLPENSVINCDSQALNMLAELALSSAAASSLPSCELRNLPNFFEVSQNNVLISKENSLPDVYDHEYHRAVKSKKGTLPPEPSSDGKINAESDLPASQDENVVPCTQPPAEAQSALPEEARESADTKQNSVAVEHSYALLLAEHSKKHLHQRKLPGSAFAKSGMKGPEAGTPIGKVIPFRHLQSTSPPQKLSEDPLTKRKSRSASSSLKDFFSSRTVLNCDGSFKITFKCEAKYVFDLDSKYTSHPLEKTVVRALHGPWNTDLPENVEEVKLLLHMWLALFYSKKNKVMGSPRKVVEHRNPAKFVCINRSLDSVDHSEIEEFSSLERYSVDPLLETNETSRGPATSRTFPGPNCMLPFIKPPPTRDLELCVQNEQKEMFTGECHLDNLESHSFIYSCNNEVPGGKAKQELSDNVLSGIASTQTNGSCIPGQDKAFQSLESTKMVPCNDTVTQAIVTTTYDGASSEFGVCQKSLFGTLESKVNTFHPTMQIKTGAVQNVTQHSSPVNNECLLSLETMIDNREHVMINPEPVTLAFENNAYVPMHTEGNAAGKPMSFTSEPAKQLSPALSLQHPVSPLEKAQTQGLRDIPSLAVSAHEDMKCLSTSSARKETHTENLCPLQKEILLVISSPSLSADKSLVVEPVSLAKSSSYSLASKEAKCPQDAFLQTPGFLSISSDEVLEPSRVKLVSSSASATLRKNCVPPRSDTSGRSSEPRDGDRSSPDHDTNILQSFNSVFPKQANISVNREEVNMDLSGEDNDTDLTLTVSPQPSPRGDMSAGEVEQLQKAPVSNLGLQDRAKEMVEPEEALALKRNQDMNSANCMPVYPLESKEPFKNEGKGDHLKPVLPKENCNLEIAEEINVTSDFPFEEVSPASSPNPVVRTEETQQSQAISSCHLKLHGTQYEKSNQFSHIKSGDLTLPEKENSFVGPTLSVGQEELTQVQQMQLSAEMPQILASHPGRLTLPHKITEEIFPGVHAGTLSFSEKVQCYDTELNKPTSPAKYGGNFRPLEKLGKSGNPLQPIYIENRNLDIKHLALESGVPSFGPRKVVESKSSADTLSTTAISGIVTMSLKQKTDSKTRKENVCDSDLKINAGVQTKSVNSTSIEGADVTQAYIYPAMSKFGSSLDSSKCTRCTKPVSIEPEFRTQEISVVRMASFLKSIKTELHEENPDLSAVGPRSNSTSTKEKQKAIHVLQNTSACEVKKFLNGGVFPNSVHSYQNTTDICKSICGEPSAFSVPESFDSVVCGVSKEHTASETTIKGDTETSVNSSMHYEPLSRDSHQDSHDDPRNHKLDMNTSCTLRKSRPSKNAIKDSSDAFVHLNNSGHDSRGYSDKIPELETHMPPRNWATEPCPILPKDKCMPCYVQIPDQHGVSRTYANFTITKEFKDATRTFHSLKRHRDFSANGSLLSSWTRTWHVADDLTQNSLDLEYLCFAHKLKQILKKGDSQPSVSTSSSPEELRAQISVEAFPSTEISESPIPHLPPRSRSPILVTVVHSDTRQQSWHRRGHSSSNLVGSSSFWKERCGHSRIPSSERNLTVPFHLNKLKYSTLKEARNDISLILNEYAEFNKVMIQSNQVLQDKGLSVASEEAVSHETCQLFPRHSASYKDVIADLCATLHVKLKGVLREACKTPFRFYLVETEDKSFFLRTKSILRKGGHTEIEPVYFCQALHRENDTLIVIIKNEDISSHLHQIPSLLKLKHFPSVIFAGVDSPEDILNDTYQDLLRSGGFVISDEHILESLTLVQLKDFVKILEKLNESGRWKWLLHYRENKRLKEDVRVDSIAHKKNLILKSCQSVNIIELLHYHACDSPSPTKATILKCLLNLQIQHIDARFAVFLTDKPTESTEVFENNGILVSDVNYFVENMQKVAAPFRSSYW